MFTEKPWWCSSMTNPLSKSVNYAHLTVISEIMIRISSNSVVLNCWVADRATYALYLFLPIIQTKWANCYMKSTLTFFKCMSSQNFLKFQYSEELYIIMHYPCKTLLSLWKKIHQVKRPLNSQNLSTIFLLISNHINKLYLHQFLATRLSQQF